MNPKEIVIFFTGGTIGMDVVPGVSGVAPGNHQDRLISALNAPKGVTIKSIVWADLPSPHISPEIMLRLTHDLDAELSRKEVLGAVVSHGTDLMAETAFFLDLALISQKPVVLTGAMLHLAEAGYDGFRNLKDSLTACLAAGNDRGLLIQMAGEIFIARDTVKMDSTALCPMLAQRHGHAGRVVDGKAFFYRRPERIGNILTLLPKPVTVLAKRVEMLKCFPGMDEHYLNYLLNNDVEGNLRGLVVEGFGAGNVPPAVANGLIEIAKLGVPVILTTRCAHSGVYPLYAYPGGGGQLLNAGLINGYGVTADKALLLLKTALGCCCNKKTIEALCAYYGQS